MNCVGTWSFCNSETILENNMIKWSPWQPDNWEGKENYASLYINWNDTVLEINDRTFDSGYPYLCEVCIYLKYKLTNIYIKLNCSVSATCLNNIDTFWT